jgi:hypothetical protein
MPALSMTISPAEGDFVQQGTTILTGLEGDVGRRKPGEERQPVGFAGDLAIRADIEGRARDADGDGRSNNGRQDNRVERDAQSSPSRLRPQAALVALIARFDRRSLIRTPQQIEGQFCGH